MALIYTSDELVESVKLQGMVPEAQSIGCTDLNILEHLTTVLQTQLSLDLLRVCEEYYVYTSRTALTAGKTEYRIPHRAMAGKLRDVMYMDSSLNRSTIEYVSREDLDSYGTPSDSTPSGYYLEGNYVKLLVGPSPTGYLEMSYFMRPGDLVLTSSARQILTVSTDKVTFATGPSTFTSSVTYDIHSRLSGAELKVWDQTATINVPATELTFATAIDGSVAGTHAVEVGDWVCLAGECVIPAIPRELHGVLVRGACLRLAEAQGDEKAMQYHGTLFNADLQRVIGLLEGRIEGRPLKIKGRHAILWQ